MMAMRKENTVKTVLDNNKVFSAEDALVRPTGHDDGC